MRVAASRGYGWLLHGVGCRGRSVKHQQSLKLSSANALQRVLPQSHFCGPQRAFSSSKGGPPDLDAIQFDKIRNFSIIAHVDHGKSTLSDRLLQLTNTIREDADAQYMDKLQVEKERGITVKAQTATLFHRGYMLNLIDTPGHVDFSYEGVEAQTLANFALAKKSELTIVPVMNKIDITSADLARTSDQMELTLGTDKEGLLMCSGKTGEGTPALLEAIIQRIPPPKGDRNAGMCALLFDTWFDKYRGVVCLLRLVAGTIQVGDKVCLKSNGRAYEVQEVGIMHPEPTPMPSLYAGQVGYVICNMKTPGEARVGDTLCALEHVDTIAALPGFEPPVPMVFAGVYPIDASEFDLLDKAMGKLCLNDTSVTVVKESSNALGLGFRCGFLGLLHMDVFRQRLEQEHLADIIVTNPTVPFIARMRKNPEEDVIVSNPSNFPDVNEVAEFQEPMIKANIIVPSEYLGMVIELCESRRGHQTEMSYLDETQVLLGYELPMGEVVIDFYDKLKSCSQGYASFNYAPSGYRQANVQKLSFLLNGLPVDALSTVVHKDNAEDIARNVALRLKNVLKREQFEVAIQAVVGSKVLARETIKAVRKNVLVKSGKTVGGGDVSRKKKLLEKQKEGKKRMKRVGNVELSQEAFLSVIKTS